MSGRTLVAGVGNIFFGDDGFGCEVARRVALQALPEGVVAEDYGIRGTHLAYEILAGYDRVILVDAVKRGGQPGTLYVIDPDLGAASPTPDAHQMDLANVFGMLRVLGGEPPEIRIVGCEPLTVEETIGLSPVVQQAVEGAIGHVNALLVPGNPVTAPL